MSYQDTKSGMEREILLEGVEPRNSRGGRHQKIKGIAPIRKQKTVSAQCLGFLFSGLVLGSVLGAVLPAYLPGMSKSGDTVVRQATGSDVDRQSVAANGANTEGDLEAAETRNSSETAYDVEAALADIPLGSQEEFVNWMLENTDEEEENLLARWQLSSDFIESGELVGDANIAAFLKTPREKFVREANLTRAYEDTWLPIGYGATITDPDVVAMMTTALDVKPNYKVLEIGTGSGYQAAILSNLSSHIYTIEIIQPLYHQTNDLYKMLESDYPSYRQMTRKLGDGFYGWEKYAPFDRIIVTCSIDHLPPPLIKQLADNGIMVVPLGPPGRQFIMEVKKTVDESGNVVLKRRDVYNGLSVKFIAFRNESGDSYSTNN